MGNYADWSEASDDEKSRIAGNYLAPFIFDEEELKAVIAEVDILKKGRQEDR